MVPDNVGRVDDLLDAEHRRVIVVDPQHILRERFDHNFSQQSATHAIFIAALLGP